MDNPSAFAKVAPFLEHPLVLVGFGLFLLFGLFRVLIKTGIIPPLPPDVGGRRAQLLPRNGFVLTLEVSVLGFAHAALQEDQPVAALGLIVLAGCLPHL